MQKYSGDKITLRKTETYKDLRIEKRRKRYSEKVKTRKYQRNTNERNIRKSILNGESRSSIATKKIRKQ